MASDPVSAPEEYSNAIDQSTLPPLTRKVFKALASELLTVVGWVNICCMGLATLMLVRCIPTIVRDLERFKPAVTPLLLERGLYCDFGARMLIVAAMFAALAGCLIVTSLTCIKIRILDKELVPFPEPNVHTSSLSPPNSGVEPQDSSEGSCMCASQRSGTIEWRWFTVGMIVLVVAIVLGSIAFAIGELTYDRRRILLWLLPLASAFTAGAFFGSITVKSRGLLPATVATATGGFAVWLITYFSLF